MHRRLAALAFAMAMVLSLVIRPQSASAHQLCFPADKTPHCLNDPFSDYWENNGGLPVFGYPITTAANEVNADTGQTYNTQWVERTRMEDHPENAGTPYRVLLGRLGAERLTQLGRGETARESGPQAGCLWFPETGKNVCNQTGNIGFKTYWESHGLMLPGVSTFGRSLQLFGLPLTSPTMETNSNGDTVLTQWFERARFEWHPGNPDEYKVLLGLLGKEVRGGGSTPPPPPATVDVVSHSSYIDDDLGYFWIHGEVVNNTGSNQRFVKIVVSMYDASNALLGSEFAYTDLDILKPGQRSPFTIVELDPPAALDHYTLQVEASATTETPLEGLVIVSQGDRASDIEGWHYIFGEVRNDTGVGVRFVKVVATLYDAEGIVVGADITYTSLADLAAGQTSPFEILLLDWPNPARYELQVQGMKQ